MNKYQELKTKNQKKREELIKKSPVAGKYGVLAPGNLNKYTPTEIFRTGTHNWTKVSMSTIILATEELGWKKYIDLLGKYQWPAQADRAKKLIEKYDIPTDTFAGFMLIANVWGSGCLFDMSPNGGQPFFSQHDSSWTMDQCPQIEALRQMGLIDRAENLHIWCDAYDNMFCGHVAETPWYSHVHCLGQKDCDVCCSYLRERGEKLEGPRGENFYEKIMAMKEEARPIVDAKTPESFRIKNMLWKQDDKVARTTEERARDGAYTKGRISAESIIIAAKAMGWEEFINKSEEMLSWGFMQNAKTIKSWAEITLHDMFAACEIVGVVYYMMDFEDHTITEYNQDRVEGYAPRCKMIDSVERLGLMEDAKDFCLWCDFYHNHYIKAINPEFSITHTHCIGKGDKECRFVVERDAK